MTSHDNEHEPQAASDAPEVGVVLDAPNLYEKWRLVAIGWEQQAAEFKALVEQAIAMLEREQAQNERYRTTLETIKRDWGQVCLEFDICLHPSCQSSVAAWLLADEALATTAPTTPGAAAEGRAELLERVAGAAKRYMDANGAYCEVAGMRPPPAAEHAGLFEQAYGAQISLLLTLDALESWGRQAAERAEGQGGE